MTKGLGVWLFLYGIWLFVAGAAFFLLSGSPVPIPLLAGAIGGGIASLMGVLFWKGAKRPYKGALIVTLVYFMLGLAISMQEWMLVKAGQPRLNAALVMSAVVIASAVMIWKVKTAPRI